MQRTPRALQGYHATYSPGSPLPRSHSMSPTHHSPLSNASSMSPMGSLSARRDSDHKRAQEAGISLLGLAFDGGHTNPMPSPVRMVNSPTNYAAYSPSQSTYYDDAALAAANPSPLDGVDPQLFLEGVKEHAKYLGMDPHRDAEFLWIARESLVAPVPAGWYQVMTKDGAPYYYNDSTGESRWEHPSDRDYMALFVEVKRKKAAGEPIDVNQLKHEIQHGRVQSAWTEDSTSYQITTEDDDYVDSSGWNSEQSQSYPQESEDGSVYGEDTPSAASYSQAHHKDKAKSKYQQSEPDESHRELVASLYAELNECKHKLQLQREHQERVESLEQRALELKTNYDAQVESTRKIEELSKTQVEENEKVKVALKSSREQVETLESSLNQLRQQLELANGEIELYKSKGAQENLELKQEVKTLTLRLKELEQSTNTNEEAQKLLKKESKLRFQWEQKYKQLEEQHQALMIQVDNANRKHEMDRHASQGNVEKYQKELELHQAKLEAELKASQEKHTQAMEALREALSSQNDKEIEEFNRQHILKLKTIQEEAHTRDESQQAQIRALEADMLVHSAALIDAKAQLQSLKQEMANSSARNKELVEKDIQSQATITKLQAEYDSLKGSVDEQLKKAKQSGIDEATNSLNLKVQATLAEKEQLAQLYAQEMKARRQLHNKVMEMAGNIRVFCRVRPISSLESKSNEAAEVVSFRPNDPQMLELAMGEGQKHTFEFDYVFQPSSAQIDVFEQTKALVVSALDGFNVCIFAYGQTGSGKTHTMEGPADDRGVNYRAMEELFRVRDERMLSGNLECDMKLSILEVYNETIVDLLDDSYSSGGGERKPLEVRMGKQGAFVENLMEVEVFSTKDVEDLMKLGHSHRSVGSHDVNEHSSRSHLVLSITITTVQKSDGKKCTSKLHLIDLAGSERISKTAASGQRLKEAQHINRSLSALGDVIASLGGHSKHVPYRNSKLTFLLQESLSGNSKVLMFVNVSPVQWNAWESLCSLNFAQRCRNVALGQAKSNATTTSGPTPSQASPPHSSASSVPKPTKFSSSSKQNTLSATEKIRVSLAPKSPKKDN